MADKPTATRDFVHAGQIITKGDPMPDALVAHIEGRPMLADEGVPDVSPGAKSSASLDAGDAAPTTGDQPGMLPEGFPHASKLEANGFVTLDQVKGATDAELIKIDGIAEKSLRAIREATGQKVGEKPAASTAGKATASDAPKAPPSTPAPPTTSDPAAAGPDKTLDATPETPPAAAQ